MTFHVHVLIFILSIFSLKTYAQTTVDSGGRKQTTQLPAPQQSTDSMIPQSNAAQDSNSSGMNFGMLGSIAGTGYAIANTPGCANPKTAAAYCPKVAIGIAAAAAGMFLQSNHAGAGAGAYNAGLQVTNPTAPPITPDTWAEKNSPIMPEYVASINRLKQLGYKVDPVAGTITTPDGKVITPNTANDPAAMADLGIDPNAMKDFMSKTGKDAMAKLKELDSKKSGGTELDDLGGAGVAGGAAGAGGGFDMPGMGGENASKKAAKREIASAAGQTRRLNGGGVIGGQDDDLFKMLGRRVVTENSKIPFEQAPQPFGEKK